jgi:hypothetical protein
MSRSRAWSQRGTQAIIKSPSVIALFHIIIDAISACGVVNVDIKGPGNV